MKKYNKSIAFLLISIFLLSNAGVLSASTQQEEYSTLSPQLSISNSYIRKLIESVLLKDDSRGPGLEYIRRSVIGKAAQPIKSLEYTKDSFHIFKSEFAEWFESIEDGTELHFAAPGGGGDSLGTIFLVKILKNVFKLMGKKNIQFKIIFPSIKYGKENPFGGDLNINYIQGISPIEIDGVDKSHFYRVTKKLKARIPMLDKSENQLVINGKPVFYEQDWSEGKIIGLAKKEGVELIMMDITQKGKDLRYQYEQMTNGKKIKTSFIDMGGDSLAQFPGPITDNNHIEAPVASPVSDLMGLVIFDGPAWILALGGDGESLKQTQEKHVSTLFIKDQVAGIFDLERYLKKRYQDPEDSIDIFSDMDEYSNLFRSEVSKNLFERLKFLALELSGKSPIEKHGAANYKDLLHAHDSVKAKVLRYEKRKEFISRLYSSIIVIDSTKSMRKNIKSKEVLDGNLTWNKLKRILRDKYNYSTEGIFYVVYRSKIKNFSDMFYDMLNNHDADPAEIITLFFNDEFDLTYQLAAVRAFYRYSHYINGTSIITENIGNRLVQMMQDATENPDMRKENVFMIAEIAKTLGIIGYKKAISVLSDFKDFPRKYGHWPFFNIYFEKYAYERINDTAERSIRMLIEKVLYQNGPIVAEMVFNEINGTHPEFKNLKQKILDAKKRLLGVPQSKKKNEAIYLIEQSI